VDPVPVDAGATRGRPARGACRARGTPRTTGNAGGSARPRAFGPSRQGRPNRLGPEHLELAEDRPPGRGSLGVERLRGRTRGRPRAWSADHRSPSPTRTVGRSKPTTARPNSKRTPIDLLEEAGQAGDYLAGGSTQDLGRAPVGRTGAPRSRTPGASLRTSRGRSARRQAPRTRLPSANSPSDHRPRRRDRPGGASRRGRARAGRPGGRPTRSRGSGGPGPGLAGGLADRPEHPKFRTEAPEARLERSNTTTRRPRRAR